MGTKYYTLAVSLPHMPDFQQATRLPISEPRLRARLKMLGEDDAAQLRAVGEVLRLHAKPVGLDDEQAAQTYRRVHAQVTHPFLKDLLAFRMDQLTILAALRRRRRDSAPPAAKSGWAMNGRMHWIVGHWERPEFGLEHVYRWLSGVRQGLESGQAASVQALLWRVLWDRLTAGQNADPFGLAGVFAWVLKWQILRLWLGQDASASSRRFEEISREIAHDQLAVI